MKVDQTLGCNNPLAAAYYADQAKQRSVVVEENLPLARDTYRVRFHCPEIARQIVPGQFLMIRPVSASTASVANANSGSGLLLGRPFALYDTVLDSAGEPVGVDIVYLVVGKMTGLLAECRPGTHLEIWGPLGNGFSAESVEHLVMVAGGIGQTPFLALGRAFGGGRQYGQPLLQIEPAEQVTLCYGVRTADLAAGVNDFQQAGINVKLSSDDGSVGHRGLVTDLLEDSLDGLVPENCRIACCGPEPMMERVAEIAQRTGVPCEVSLETPMACGIGICFSCVARVLQPDGTWDYKRTCVDGPVFDSRQIAWS